MAHRANDSKPRNPSTAGERACLAPEECRREVEAFRAEVIAFTRKLASFPEWKAAAITLDVEAHAWANLAGSLADELTGEGDPVAAAELVEDADVGGLLRLLHHPGRETHRDRLTALGDALRNLEEGDFADNRQAEEHRL